jgi:hypothetical protein
MRFFISAGFKHDSPLILLPPTMNRERRGNPKNQDHCRA